MLGIGLIKTKAKPQTPLLDHRALKTVEQGLRESQDSELRKHAYEGEVLAGTLTVHRIAILDFHVRELHST